MISAVEPEAHLFWRAGRQKNLQNNDRLTREIESFPAAHIPASHHIVHAHHVRSSLRKFRAIVGIASRRHGVFLRAHHPAHRKSSFFPTMRAHQRHLLGLGLLVVEPFLIHHLLARPRIPSISSMLTKRIPESFQRGSQNSSAFTTWPRSPSRTR